MLVLVKWEKYDSDSQMELPALISGDLELLIHFAIFITKDRCRKLGEVWPLLKVRANNVIVYQGFERKIERRQTKVYFILVFFFYVLPQRGPSLKHEVSFQPGLPSWSPPYKPSVFIFECNIETTFS